MSSSDVHRLPHHSALDCCMGRSKPITTFIDGVQQAARCAFYDSNKGKVYEVRIYGLHHKQNASADASLQFGLVLPLPEFGCLGPGVGVPAVAEHAVHRLLLEAPDEEGSVGYCRHGGVVQEPRHILQLPPPRTGLALDPVTLVTGTQSQSMYYVC